jgi:hypothetical protein
VATFLLRAAVGVERTKERTIEVVTMASRLQVLVDALRRLRVHRNGQVLPALPDEVEAPVPLVLMEVLHGKACDLGAPCPDLKADRQECSVAQSPQCRGVGCVEQRPSLFRGE